MQVWCHIGSGTVWRTLRANIRHFGMQSTHSRGVSRNKKGLWHPVQRSNMHMPQRQVPARDFGVGTGYQLTAVKETSRRPRHYPSRRDGLRIWHTTSITDWCKAELFPLEIHYNDIVDHQKLCFKVDTASWTCIRVLHACIHSLVLCLDSLSWGSMVTNPPSRSV